MGTRRHLCWLGLRATVLWCRTDSAPVWWVLGQISWAMNPPLHPHTLATPTSALVKVLASRGVPLIEDVVFNDLMAADERRKAAKAFDTDGRVMV